MGYMPLEHVLEITESGFETMEYDIIEKLALRDYNITKALLYHTIMVAILGKSFHLEMRLFPYILK